ncbi:class I SAM-dependent methyltransferase [Caldalkalibacillus salinus]|uniref:class I SAM-dependent methyltransferase n=1 Tax=Caldalkalibacillus salinus TaxID=2803787 RepID=UPI0019227FF3|nr:class I SAM-dependent methyltransferase [Caldalkalibacillus salinus]
MNKNFKTQEAIRRWDMHAETFASGYSEVGDIHREVFLNPTLLDLLDSVHGKRVLDAGCGEGYLSRMLSKLGASVLGIDYSNKMLEIAKDRTPKSLDIRYEHGNLEDLSFLEDQSFDLIVSNMVIQDLSEYDRAINEMYRLLVDGGWFIFSILHPCFITPGSGWVKSEDGEKLYWKVDNYFYEGAYEQAIPLDQDEKLVYFHRTLTSYVDTVIRAGFRIEQLVEPKPSSEILEKYPSFTEDFRCSDFLVFKLAK